MFTSAMKILILAAIAFGLTVAPVADAGTARPVVQRARAGCSWKPVGITGGTQLHAVSAVTGSDIWAVGNTNSVGKPFAIHYDGSDWKAVPMPAKGAGRIDLYDVDAISKKNVWAVGYYTDGNGHSRTLTEHWNGTSWKIVPSPNKGTGDNTLLGVAAVSGSHVWAVGYWGPTAGDEGPLIEHWDGTSGRLFPPAGLGGISRRLEDVAVVAPSNIVAVGHTPSNAHIERYDGLRWTTESDAAMQTGNAAELWAVSATSAGAQWAVGDFIYQSQPVAERYIGHGWVLKPPTNVGAKPNELKGVSALSATSAFAVGNYTTSGGTRRALAERFANGSWTTFKPPNATQFDNELESVAAISASNVWAVGFTAKNASGVSRKPLIEHFLC
ncbi:MAG TPA: hypothetical protein VID47_13445 [Actinomycetota bacterium]